MTITHALRIRCGLILLAIAFTPLALRNASATVIHGEYTARVSTVSPGISLSFAVGELVSGRFMYYEASPNLLLDLPGQTQVWQFPEVIYEFDLRIGNYTTAFSRGGLEHHYVILNDGMPGTVHEDGLYVFANGPNLTGAEINGFTLQTGQVALTDYSGTAFSSNHLSGLLGLSDFDIADVIVSFGRNGGQEIASVRANIDSLVITPIPEPATLILLGVGIAGALSTFSNKSARRRSRNK